MFGAGLLKLKPSPQFIAMLSPRRAVKGRCKALCGFGECVHVLSSIAVDSINQHAHIVNVKNGGSTLTYDERYEAVASALHDRQVLKVAKAVSLAVGTVYNIRNRKGRKPLNSTLVVLSQYLGIKE